MDKEKEVATLKERLKILENNIQTELDKIKNVKGRLTAGYRRRDKEKYEAERKAITESLKKYGAEMDEVKRKLSELEATPL